MDQSDAGSISVSCCIAYKTKNMLYTGQRTYLRNQPFSPEKYAKSSSYKQEFVPCKQGTLSMLFRQG
eukprot:647561-Prorocentrum_minimum.AAC.1